jgi:cardiolipin synthase
MKKEFLSVPNVLTLSRISLIPIIIILFYIRTKLARFFNVLLFSIASLSDFLDGYLARRLKQTSAFGRFLDPVADKLLVSVMFIMLVGFDLIDGINVIAPCLIIAREIIIMALREILAEKRIIVHVIKLAKCKTFLQCTTIAFYLSSEIFPSYFPSIVCCSLLWMSALITIYTGYEYLVPGIQKLVQAKPET